jgi:hypothetical protein
LEYIRKSFVLFIENINSRKDILTKLLALASVESELDIGRRRSILRYEVKMNSLLASAEVYSRKVIRAYDRIDELSIVDLS